MSDNWIYSRQVLSLNFPRMDLPELRVMKESPNRIHTLSSPLDHASDALIHIEQLLRADHALLLQSNTDGHTLVALLKQVSCREW